MTHNATYGGKCTRWVIIIVIIIIVIKKFLIVLPYEVELVCYVVVCFSSG